MIPQHSSKSNEHYTPLEIVEAARRVMGGIDLDPASCEEANKTVKAAAYYDQDDDGLECDWYGRVFLNPPGGRMSADMAKRYGSKSSAACWWGKLMTQIGIGQVKEAIFIGFTVEIVRSTQVFPAQVLHFPMCFPKQRLRFSGEHPSHANVIAYVGRNVAGFEKEFEQFGHVVIPQRKDAK